MGDLFELPLPDGRHGYGLIVKWDGLAPYIAIFRSAHPLPPPVAEITKDELALLGWTTDAYFYHGRWKVIGRDFALPAVPFQNFKVERKGKFHVVDVEGKAIGLATPRELELLDYRSSHSAGIFQDAFEALHGLREWLDYYSRLTPAHAQARITRPSS